MDEINPTIKDENDEKKPNEAEDTNKHDAAIEITENKNESNSEVDSKNGNKKNEFEKNENIQKCDEDDKNDDYCEEVVENEVLFKQKAHIRSGTTVIKTVKDDEGKIGEYDNCTISRLRQQILKELKNTNYLVNNVDLENEKKVDDLKKKADYQEIELESLRKMHDGLLKNNKSLTLRNGELKLNLNERLMKYNDSNLKIQKLKEENLQIMKEKNEVLREIKKRDIDLLKMQKEYEKEILKVKMKKNIDDLRSRIWEDEDIISQVNLKVKQKKEKLKEKEKDWEELFKTIEATSLKTQMENVKTIFEEKKELLEQITKLKDEIRIRENKIDEISIDKKSLNDNLKLLKDFISSTNPVDGRGFLQFYSGKLLKKNWNLFYFECDNVKRIVKMFKNAESKKPIKTFIIESPFICHEISTEKKFSFSLLSNSSNGKTLDIKFAAANEIDLKRWIFFWKRKKESIFNFEQYGSKNDKENEQEFSIKEIVV